MNKELFTKEIGTEANVSIKLDEGKVKIILGYDGKGADAGMYVDLEVDYFLNLLKEAIPGQIDDLVIDMLASAMKA